MSAAKHALIFGGTRGIGLSVAHKFLKEGFNISIASRSQRNVNSALQYLNKQNTKSCLINGFACDVSDESSVSQTFKSVQERCKNIDILVNAAGINVDSLLMSCSKDVLQAIVATNLIGTIFTCKHCVKCMLRQRNGSIVNIGSIIGLKGNSGQTVYSASKAGIVGLTKSLAKEVAAKGITVNAISPGFIETELTANIPNADLVRKIPLKRFGSADEVSESVFFIANASFITGEVFVVDGGLSLQF